MKHRKVVIFSFLFLFVSICISGQKKNEPAEISPAVNSVDSSIIAPDDFIYSLDYLLHNWLVGHITDFDCDTSIPPVIVSDSIIKLRLKKLPYVMEMPYNSYIRSFIDLYTIKKRKQLSFMLGMGDFYFKIFEQSLDKAKLPLELKYLPVIESALHVSAISRVGAAGLWQFMIGTGKMYGLEVNSLVDERLDPVKSSDAAALFLKDLYSIYGDWHLVIAAYNCGPGNVNRAIRRAGGKRDYWAIYPYLPRETRGYVPVFIAANYAMNYAPEHNICKVRVPIPKVVDTVMVHNRIHMDQISAVLDIPADQLKLMNPQYRRSLIPGDIKPYALTLPLRKAGKFIDKLPEILAYKADSLVDNRRSEIEIVSREPRTPGGDDKVVYYTVKSGQNLGSIAAKYDVSVAKIKKWNHLKSNKILKGQRLIIYR